MRLAFVTGAALVSPLHQRHLLLAPVALRRGGRALLCTADTALEHTAAASSAADETFMSAALRQAEAAFEAGEVPIGAVIVHDGVIIAEAHNRVEALRDASAHAEMLCARAAAAHPSWPSWRLHKTTLYCTVEPCPMCLAALHAFRVDRLVYGAPNPRLGAIEGALRPQSDFEHPYHSLSITSGVLAEEAGELMRSFFKRRRKQPSFAQQLTHAPLEVPSAAISAAVVPSGAALSADVSEEQDGVRKRVARAVRNFCSRQRCRSRG